MATKRAIETLKLLLAGYDLYVMGLRRPNPRAFVVHPQVQEDDDTPRPTVPYPVVRTLIEEGLIEGEKHVTFDGGVVGQYWLSPRGVQTLRHHALGLKNYAEGLKNYAEDLLTTIDRSQWGTLSAPLLTVTTADEMTHRPAAHPRSAAPQTLDE